MELFPASSVEETCLGSPGNAQLNGLILYGATIDLEEKRDEIIARLGVKIIPAKCRKIPRRITVYARSFYKASEKEMGVPGDNTSGITARVSYGM